MKLLCIDDSRGPGSEHFQNWVQLGETYTLRRAEGSLEPGKQRYLLKEIKNPPIFVGELGIKAEPGFASTRFVVLEEDGALAEGNKKEELIIN